MSDLFIQIETFFLTLILGILTGLIFHYYQLTIVKARVGKYPLYILDFFLWIIMICLVFFTLLWINQGEMRVYVLIALLSGILIYYHYFSSRFKKFVDTSASLTISFFKKGADLIIWPFKWVYNQVKSAISKKNTPPPNEDD